MGYATYSSDSRLLRSASKGYATKSRDDIFEQNKKRMIHESMAPKQATLRECCDSEAHPNTVPVELFLDVTGSMGQIPHQMIKDGLPKLIGSLIQNGIPDVSLMFGAIGDHECDRHPLQIGQFECGDEEMDMWLERTYIEGGGGGNAGESYLLAWYFAANHVKTDAFDKRGKKGYVFTVGDEPTLRYLPMSAVREQMGEQAVGQETLKAKELFLEASKKNHVYHIHIVHNSASNRVIEDWRNLIGENLIVINDQNELASTISKIILSQEGLNYVEPVAGVNTNITLTPVPAKPAEEILL